MDEPDERGSSVAGMLVTRHQPVCLKRVHESGYAAGCAAELGDLLGTHSHGTVSQNVRRDELARVAPNAGSERARSEYAELVALRVRKNNPGLLALSYVRSRGSQREQSIDLGVSVVRTKSRCRRFFVVFGSETDTKRSPEADPPWV